MRAGAAYSRPHDRRVARPPRDSTDDVRPGGVESGASHAHYYDIKLDDKTIGKREMHGEEIVRAGRYFIAKTLLELGAATVDRSRPPIR